MKTRKELENELYSAKIELKIRLIVIIFLTVLLTIFVIAGIDGVNKLQKENQQLKEQSSWTNITTQVIGNRPCDIFKIVPIDNQTILIKFTNCEVLP